MVNATGLVGRQISTEDRANLLLGGIASGAILIDGRADHLSIIRADMEAFFSQSRHGMAAQVERDVSGSSDLGKVIIDLPGIEGGIAGEAFGAKAESLFGLGHQLRKELDILYIKRFSMFGEDEFAQLAVLGDDRGSAIAP